MSLEDFFLLCKRWLTSDRFNHVVTLNPEMVMLAEGDTTFREAMQAAELRVPLLTSSLTTSAAFLPIYLAESSTGEYTAPPAQGPQITEI